MKTLFKTLFVLPTAIFIIILAAANRDMVKFSLDPTPNPAPEWAVNVPLFLLLFSALLLGILIGGMASWLNQGKHRKAERKYRKEADEWRGQFERLKSASLMSSNNPPI
jgi:uncharacterized integral membrane protein